MKLNMFAAGALALAFSTPALAGDIKVMEAYARSASPSAKSGAAFMVLHNKGAESDRLINAASDIAARVELHTHIDNGDGVMLMRHDEDGFEIPAGGMHALARGGDHVMFMGLTAPMKQGDIVLVTLTFEKAGDLVVEIPVDLERKPGEGHGHMKHSH